MKAHLKTILLLGFSGLAAVVGFTTLPRVTASSSNPIAEVEVAQASQGSSLAAELQGRPTVVKIYADWCPACQRLRPVTDSLQQQFSDRANFIVFDVTNRATTQAAEAKARELGLSDFLAAHRAQTSTVAILNPSNGQVLTQFRYNFNSQDYTNAIERAIARTSAQS